MALRYTGSAFASLGEERDFRPVASALFGIAGIKDRVRRFSQSYVRDVVGGECVP